MDKLEAEVIRLRYANAKLVEKNTSLSSALQAALEDLAKTNSALTSEQIAHGKTMRERDEFAAALATAIHRMSCPMTHCKECDAYKLYDRPSDTLAAHDRAVAARVLRQTANGYLRDAVCDWQTTHITVGKELVLIAAQYEAGEREVPGE